MLMILWLICICGSLASDDFLIDTDECQIPDFPAFSVESNRSYIPLDYVNCSSRELLTYTTVMNNTAHLHIQTKYLNMYYKSEKDINCCYSYVNRKGTTREPDIGVSVSSCQFFNSSITLKEDTVMVKCLDGTAKIYENVHRPMIITNTVERKLHNGPGIQRISKKKHISVLLIVVDSVSRLNLARTMPSSKKFLLENDFLELVGYNKIGDNTFPNFNALITGLNLSESDSICQPRRVGGLDQCPMVWYNFRDKGYVTAYAEDYASISTYNYGGKKGFKNPPTDYYFKPYLEASDRLTPLRVDRMPYCSGPESQGERILKLAKDFTKTFKGYPYFGIFWMNTFSHDNINSPGRMDKKIANFFKDLKQNGVLNESMVVFLSDHGIRFGNIRRTVQGWYEERLPMNLISLPPWFQREYLRKYRNLKRNAKKLTSTYDLFLTLQEVLSLSVNNYVMSNSRGCPSCQSLFSDIPIKRDCEQAGIPEVWCTCLGKFHENDGRITSDMNNKALALFMSSSKLTGLRVNNILHSSISRGPKGKEYFLIVFRINPSTLYQALYRINRPSTNSIKLIQFMRLH